MQGDVWVIHVYPETHPLSHLTPCLFVGPDAFFALVVEGLHAVILDSLIRHQIEFLLHLYLYRKPMGIPSSFALNNMPLHGLPSTDHVLEQPREDVMDSRLTVCRRRSLEEGEGARAAPARLDSRLKSPLFTPGFHQGIL